MEKGKFIVIEGINGCGKGVQFDKLSSYIRSLGKAKRIICTGEPNDMDENGKMAREILARDSDPYKNAVEAVGYFAKNRITHNAWFVPQLTVPGVDVLSDRYWHSNFAFQHAQGVPYEDVAIANKSSMVPDLTIIIDLPASVASFRLSGRDGDSRRKFDTKVEFLEKVRQNYLELPKILPGLIDDESIVIVDGNKSIDEVWENIKTVYDEKFGEKVGKVNGREIVYSTKGMSGVEKAKMIEKLEKRYGVEADIL